MFEINGCCLNINYPFNVQIHVGSNKVYLDVTIHNSHTLMGTFGLEMFSMNS